MNTAVVLAGMAKAECDSSAAATEKKIQGTATAELQSNAVATEELVGNNGANESTNEDGASSLPSHKEGFYWPSLLSRMQTNAKKYGTVVHPEVVDNIQDSINFFQVCEAHETDEIVVALVGWDTDFDNSYYGILYCYKPYWAHMFFVFEDGFGTDFQVPPHIKWLSTLSSQSRSTELVTVRKDVSQITEKVNGFTIAWDRVDNWSHVIKEMKERCKIRSRSLMMVEFSTTLTELTEGSGWEVYLNSFVPQAVLEANHHITFERPATLSSINKAVSGTEKNLLCFCVDKSDSDDVPRASLVAIVKGTSTVVWCDIMGGEDASKMIAPAARAISNSLNFRLVKTSICATHWSEHTLSVGHVKSFHNISLLLKDAGYLKKCLEDVKKLANTNGKDVTSSAPTIHSGANKDAQGTGAEASGDAANVAVKHDGSVHATAAATAAADQVGRKNSRPGGSVAAAAAQGTGAEAFDDAANVALKHDASDDATAASTSAAHEAGQRIILDANKIRKKDWSPEIAARCLPISLVTFETNTTNFPLMLMQPNKASWLKPKQCPGVALSTPILNDYFQQDFRKMLEDYVKGCKGKDKGGRLRPSKDRSSVDEVIVFEPSHTDENKGKWRWVFAGDINYTSFDGSNRETSRHSELKRLKWGKVEHLKDFLAFLDFTARYGCIASGIAEDGAPLKHGRMQSVFWDRTEINLHRAGAQRDIKTNEGHFVVHFVIGGNCDIKFTLGQSSKQKAQLKFKAGSLCVVSGKTRFSGTQEIKCGPDPQGIENIPSTPNAPILVTLYYVVVSPTMSRKLMAVENGDVSMSIALEVDASNGGGEQVLTSRLELCVPNQVATAIEKKAKDSSGEASSAKKRKRVSKLRSQVSEDFKLTLPGIDGELDGTVRGNSTTFVNFFHSTSGLTLKCGVQVYSALHHTGHRCFIGCGLPVVLKETYKASKYCSLGFTAVFSGYVVWLKNSVVHILTTFVHDKEPKKDFMFLTTLNHTIHWPSQESTYEWRDPRFPSAALSMQRAWVSAMDKAWKRNKVDFVQRACPVKNIGTAPVSLALVPVTAESSEANAVYTEENKSSRST